MSRPGSSRRRPSSSSRSLVVDSIAPTGEGVARDDGRAVFVRGALPGERVEAVVSGGRTLRGRLTRVMQASPDRVEPPCPHARSCGGCDLMHAEPGAQRRLHAAIVEQATGMSASVLGGAALPTERYRSRARLTLRADGRRVVVGYRKPRSHDVCHVDSCLVLCGELEALLALLPAMLAGSRGEGSALLALGASRRPVVELHWKGELGPTLFEGAAAAVDDGRVQGIRVWPEGATAPATFGDPQAATTAADGEVLALAAGGFAQASEAGSIALARRVAELAGAGGRIVELFAGSGTLSVLLARQADSFIAVEQEAPAVEALRENLKRRALSAKIKTADAGGFKIPRPVRCVVLDPPRAGASSAVDKIITARPSRIVYVSCNPVTLGRDAKALVAGGFALESIDLFELFPHTSHVESVAFFQRR